MTNHKSTLSAPIFSRINLSQIDSRNIVTTLQYQMVINLNLNLLEYDNNTNITTLLADDFSVNDKQIIFNIRKGMYTVGGHEIKGRDAEVSLRRMIYAKGSHSKLKDLLCDYIKDEPCEAIHSKDYNLTLNAKSKSYVPIILTLLTIADNVIYPLTALSSDSDDSTIINFKETTGPYYIDQDKIVEEDLSAITLKLNEKHFLSQNMPSAVTYRKIDAEKLIINDKLNTDFNYIHNVLELYKTEINSLEKDKSILSYKTAPLRNTMIFSTERGRKKLTSAELIYFQLLIKKVLLQSTENYPEISFLQKEFYPKGSDSNLTQEQLNQLEERYKIIQNSSTPNKKITLGLYKSYYDKYAASLNNSSMKVVQISNPPVINNSENVDLFIDTIDSGFKESLDSLEYARTFKIFNISDHEMNDYLNSENKAERLKILQSIHFNTLMEGYCLNIGSSPYTTILSKEWEASPSTMFVGYPVWKIKKKN
ncbi:hypothetical protein C0V70_01780 [Bacteriovorax stolpii]|uniref:Uncharacterized protein n=1 Tax=Bacteriovorax stolpii TaxID=960 RepID=A0A2K9NQ08_BACTC|nr:hypothetical protein [Bacteriovorax stolpii]AUN96854.1 hypothetical protein C0V70_01780 [Bacteriovorax stolpii]TDP53132.1 hypothetical protein C8D79_1773 [Bacteriovorax stolpii]